MKRTIAKYLLYIYTSFIKNDDAEFYKKWAQPYIKIVIFFRKIYIWIASIIFFPIFVINMTIKPDKRFLDHMRNGKYNF